MEARPRLPGRRAAVPGLLAAARAQPPQDRPRPPAPAGRHDGAGGGVAVGGRRPADQDAGPAARARFAVRGRVARPVRHRDERGDERQVADLQSPGESHGGSGDRLLDRRYGPRSRRRADHDRHGRRVHEHAQPAARPGHGVAGASASRHPPRWRCSGGSSRCWTCRSTSPSAATPERWRPCVAMCVSSVSASVTTATVPGRCSTSTCTYRPARRPLSSARRARARRRWPTWSPSSTTCATCGWPRCPRPSGSCRRRRTCSTSRSATTCDSPLRMPPTSRSRPRPAPRASTT